MFTFEIFVYTPFSIGIIKTSQEYYFQNCGGISMLFSNEKFTLGSCKQYL
jgi:hypothetical protein